MNILSNIIVQHSISILLGAISGGLLGSIIAIVLWWLNSRANIRRELLLEANVIQSLEEAWVLVGFNYKHIVLSCKKELSTSSSSTQYLKKVEVRAVLDDAKWNTPHNYEDYYYGFIDSRRTWIVRNFIKEEDKNKPFDFHPALISSRGLEEVCAWIEQVVEAKWRLYFHGFRMLKPLLDAVAKGDRIEVFETQNRLTNKAIKFLKHYEKKHLKQKYEKKSNWLTLKGLWARRGEK